MFPFDEVVLSSLQFMCTIIKYLLVRHNKHQPGWLYPVINYFPGDNMNTFLLYLNACVYFFYIPILVLRVLNVSYNLWTFHSPDISSVYKPHSFHSFLLRSHSCSSSYILVSSSEPRNVCRMPEIKSNTIVNFNKRQYEHPMV